LKEEIQLLKEYFRDHYQSRAALNSPPHITLIAPFHWKNEKETFLISSLTDFAKSSKPFTIELQNFSSFKPRVIFVNVIGNEALNKLQCELDQFCRSKLNLFHSAKSDHPFHPHLTLAFRDLKKDKFFKAWEEFSQRKFSGSFIINRISLLKHNGKIWELYKDFHF
jgi:2'-5' RNA ligase